MEQINIQKPKAKLKRLEENYKLVFKRGLKFLFNAFKKQRHLRLRKA